MGNSGQGQHKSLCKINCAFNKSSCKESQNSTNWQARQDGKAGFIDESIIFTIESALQTP